MALSVDMLHLSKNSLVADALEISMYNGAWGSMHPSGRWFTYDTPMDGCRVPFFADYNWQTRPGSPEFNCCSATGAKMVGQLCEWATIKEADGLTVNYFGQGEIKTCTPCDKPLRVQQETAYPLDGTIRLTIHLQEPERFLLRIRIPSWSCKTTVKVGREPIINIQAGRYLELDKTWTDGDNVELDLDMEPWFSAGEYELKDKCCMYRGPILMAYDEAHNKTSIQERLPKLDAASLQEGEGETQSIYPPWMLFSYSSDEEETIQLCDFSSAGMSGSHYVTWFHVDHVIRREFTRDTSWGGWIWKDVQVTPTGGWQKVVLTLDGATVDAGFDKTQFQFMKVDIAAGHDLQAGDMLSFADMRVYYTKDEGKPEPEPDPEPDLDDGIEREDIWGYKANTALMPSAVAGLTYSSVAAEGIDTKTALEITLDDAGKFNRKESALYIYPDSPREGTKVDLSERLETLRFFMWVKVPEGNDNVKLDILLGCPSWSGWISKTVTVKESGIWQQIVLDVKTMKKDAGFDMTQFQFVQVRAGDGAAFLDGEKLYLANLRLAAAPIDKPDPEPDPEPEPDPGMEFVDVPIWGYTGESSLAPVTGQEYGFVTVNDELLEVTKGLAITLTDANKFNNGDAVYFYPDYPEIGSVLDISENKDMEEICLFKERPLCSMGNFR